MLDFYYRNGELFIEDLPLSLIADTYGTPSYVYSKKTISDNYLAYANALGQRPGKICYAVKANSNIAILQLLASLGAGFDIVSIGELDRVMMAGGKPEDIIFSGVGKTKYEMAKALECGISCFNVESVAELETLAQVANELNTTANISLRVNPDVDAQTHPYISTGLKENKFGIDINLAPEVYQRAAQLPSLNIVGIDCHIGSQLTNTEPFLDAIERLLRLLEKLSSLGISIQHLDLGGGLGVNYSDETPPAIDEYIHQIIHHVADFSGALYFEPGRSIVANAGALLTEVIYLKPTDDKNFAVVDAAMNDNIRPALYQAWQNMLPLNETPTGVNSTWDFVGPICESADFLAKDRPMTLSQGDRLALMSSGAYGFVMSCNYNSRGRAPEILVDGNQHYLIRERETFDDIVRGEHLLQNLRGTDAT